VKAFEESGGGTVDLFCASGIAALVATCAVDRTLLVAVWVGRVSRVAASAGAAWANAIPAKDMRILTRARHLPWRGLIRAGWVRGNWLPIARGAAAGEE
jgi:hypothetical protein